MCVGAPAGPSGRLADKFKGVGPDGLVSPGTILSDGDVTINMQVRLCSGSKLAVLLNLFQQLTWWCNMQQVLQCICLQCSAWTKALHSSHSSHMMQLREQAALLAWCWPACH